MPNDVADASRKPRTLRMIGTGEHHLTKLLDADSGEDIGIQFGITRIEYRIGDRNAYPNGRLILELACPVIIEIEPSSEMLCGKPATSTEPNGPHNTALSDVSLLD